MKSIKTKITTGRSLLILLLVPFLFMSACKKKRAFNEEDAQDSVDVRSEMGEIDEVLKDLNTVISEQFLLRGRPAKGITSSSTTVCGALVDTTRLTSGLVVITYTGAACYGRTRTGTVRAEFANYPTKKWKDKGSEVNVTISDYKVTRGSDGRSWELDGTLKMLNQTGGTWYDLQYLNQSVVINDLSAENFKITFSTGEYALISISRRLNYSYASQNTSCKVEGIGSADGVDQLECWGENRSAVAIKSKVTTAYTWSSACGATAPLMGETEIRMEGKDHVLKSQYGVDKDGNPIGAGTCPFGCKVTWDYKNKTNTRIFGFY